jgi:hypothetical protein
MAYVYVFQSGGDNLFWIGRLATSSLGLSSPSSFR